MPGVEVLTLLPSAARFGQRRSSSTPWRNSPCLSKSAMVAPHTATSPSCGDSTSHAVNASSELRGRSLIFNGIVSHSSHTHGVARCC